MSKIALIALKAVGGSALFAVSFVGFAKVNGVPLHSLPGIGGLFPAEPGTQDPADGSEHPLSSEAQTTTKEQADSAATKPEVPTPEANPKVSEAGAKPAAGAASARPQETRAGILDMLNADGLYTQDELRALALSLKTKNHEADQRGAELDRREDLLADRLTALDERRRVMDGFAKSLDVRERELKAREAEVNRDANSTSATPGKTPPPADLSAFFADGETEVLVQRLAGFTPAESAQILIRLPPTRAKELLDGLPNARWREFAEAYARAAQKPPE